MNGKMLGLLVGIFVLLKDNIESDELFIMVGLMVLFNNNIGWNVFIVVKLKVVGVIVLGKINLLEWVNFCFELLISGWSVVGGFICNLYMLLRSVCGFLLGLGVVMLLCLVFFVVGMEINGFIICLVFINGVVGFKLIVGLFFRIYIVFILFS